MRFSMIAIIPMAMAMATAGCSDTFNAIKVAGHPVVVESSQYGANRELLDRLPYTPAKVTPVRSGRAVCYDYDLNHAGRVSPYFVAFRDNNEVSVFGFTRCDDALARGLLHGKPRERFD